VLIVKLMALDLDGIETLAGTAAFVLSLARVMVVPEGPATPLRYTAPFSLVPPSMEAVVSLSALRAAGKSSTVVCSVCPLQLAVTLTYEIIETGAVLTLNVALFVSGCTLTEAGTKPSELLTERDTKSPGLPALTAKVAVPRIGEPPTTAFAEVDKPTKPPDPNAYKLLSFEPK
jgi:hypothetical protein